MSSMNSCQIAYCVKCKMKREMQNAQPLFNTRGAAFTRGTCSVCGTALTRFGQTDAHAALDRKTGAAGRVTSDTLEGKSQKAKGKGENLVIVESPAKARTVGRFLGGGYAVRASIGHIRDLPERQMGVDLEHDFKPHYVIPPKKKEIVKELREYAERAGEIYLATDPDREGEAIAWHLAAALDEKIRGKPLHRVEFHEITREAIDHAFQNPREIDQARVNAQQARRVLDRIVGYTLSPLLRKKMSQKNLSAGRVQSVAVRLVVEREREIQAFVPVEYWTIEAELQKIRNSKIEIQNSNAFRAKLLKIGEKDFECHVGAEAVELKAVLEKCAYVVLDVRRKQVQRNPYPPFITSTLQQDAARKLGFTAKRTMAVAQQLYEGLPIGAEGNVGLITYMRTDSTNVAESAQKEAWAYIKEKFGETFLPKTPRVYAKKVAGAQEAHEAIRPTSTFREPARIKQHLDADQFRLYELVWKRFVASQMASAILDTTSVDIGAFPDTARPTLAPYLFRATGSIVIFPGFLAVYTETKDEPSDEDDEAKRKVPPLTRDELLDLLGIYPEQHFTQPPPRYTEATLIKALEEYGIGRPSTYAPILSTIQERGYVERIEGKRLKPAEIGFIVNDLLVAHFAEVVDVGFTAKMEESLDKVAAGEEDWIRVLRAFYDPFRVTLTRAESEMPSVSVPVETTDVVCDVCGAPMVIRRGKFGKFLACSTFPKCKNTKNLAAAKTTGVKCPECGQGEIVEKRTKKQRVFYSCNRYPACKFALWDKPIATPCPKCGSVVVQKGGKFVCTKGDYASETMT